MFALSSVFNGRNQSRLTQHRLQGAVALLMALPSRALLRVADVLILRVYFLVDGSLNRRGDWVRQQLPPLMLVVEMRTFGPFDILLFSGLRRVAVNRNNDICRCAHVEVFLAGLWCVFFFHSACGGRWETALLASSHSP